MDTETKMYIDNEIEKLFMETEQVFAKIRRDMTALQKRVKDLESQSKPSFFFAFLKSTIL